MWSQDFDVLLQDTGFSGIHFEINNITEGCLQDKFHIKKVLKSPTFLAFSCGNK